MDRIILVSGGNKNPSENYKPRSLARFNPSCESPFWLDLLSPSERLLHRISIPFRFHPRALKACLSGRQSPSCEDFGHYLFIKTFLLEPSKKSPLIRADMKIFLSSDYLVTIHKRSAPLHHLLPALQGSGFTHPARLLLTLFDQSIATLEKSFSSQESTGNVLNKDGLLKKNQVWRQQRNLNAALLGLDHLLHHLALMGARFFNAEDKNTLESFMAKMSHLSSQINSSLIGEKNECQKGA